MDKLNFIKGQLDDFKIDYLEITTALERFDDYYFKSSLRTYNKINELYLEFKIYYYFLENNNDVKLKNKIWIRLELMNEWLDGYKYYIQLNNTKQQNKYLFLSILIAPTILLIMNFFLQGNLNYLFSAGIYFLIMFLIYKLICLNDFVLPPKYA